MGIFGIPILPPPESFFSTVVSEVPQRSRVSRAVEKMGTSLKM